MGINTINEDEELAKRFDVFDKDPVDSNFSDRFELQDDYIEPTSRREHRGFGKKGGKGSIKSVQLETHVQDKLSPVNEVKGVIEKIKISASDLTEKEQRNILSRYASWVSRSLEMGIPDYDEKEVEEKENVKLIVMTHRPTTFFGMDSSTDLTVENRKQAEYKLFARLENHLKDWKRVPEEFRNATLNKLGVDKLPRIK